MQHLYTPPAESGRLEALLLLAEDARQNPLEPVPEVDKTAESVTWYLAAANHCVAMPDLWA
jgi:hypothetical protein